MKNNTTNNKVNNTCKAGIRVYLPKGHSPGHGVVAMHDGINPSYEFVNADNLLQVLFRQLQNVQNVQPKEIVPKKNNKK